MLQADWQSESINEILKVNQILIKKQLIAKIEKNDFFLGLKIMLNDIFIVFLNIYFKVFFQTTPFAASFSGRYFLN